MGFSVARLQVRCERSGEYMGQRAALPAQVLYRLHALRHHMHGAAIQLQPAAHQRKGRPAAAAVLRVYLRRHNNVYQPAAVFQCQKAHAFAVGGRCTVTITPPTVTGWPLRSVRRLAIWRVPAAANAAPAQAAQVRSHSDACGCVLGARRSAGLQRMQLRMFIR
ncbi:error-prone DNA polymerase, partial [Anaerolineaceae bacterium]